jgi:hypothetical protein
MRVYHTKYPVFGGMADEPPPRWPQDYELVAEIDQGGRSSRDALEYVFHLTQNIEQSWTENEGVRAFGTRCRSTSAGDAVALEDGSLYRCDMNGWTQIGTTWVGRTQEASHRHPSEPRPQPSQTIRKA